MAGVDVAILSCSLQLVIERVTSPILKEFQSRYGADQDLKKLRRVLLKMQAVLNDAEQKQKTNTLVKEWLDDFNDLVYDAEDVLDLYATQVGRWNQVCNSSNASSTSTNVSKKKKEFDIESPLKEIIQKSEELEKEMVDLHLKPDRRPTTEIVQRGRETGSLVDESRVYGRENDTNKIVDLLLADGPSGGEEVGVLPIVGMGGLGKTTLAQLVCNDERVVKHFDLKAWVCVSEETDVGRITKAILESVTKVGCNLEYLDAVQGKLKDALNGNRFLVVLDDIWNDDPQDWEHLRVPFRFGKQGSKILVTTRSEKVSKIMGTISAYSLGVLANKDCWSLFLQRAFVDDEYLQAHPNLEAIGKEIVKKCKGLPLAAKALGALVRFKDDVDEWKDILTTDIWDIPEEGENNILAILRLSYQQLPPHLKQCFVYCSIFPKDFVFEKERLVWMWMAEGFLHFSGKKRMEDMGSIYFDDLFSRSFFQYNSFGESKFVMHDLVHDLAQSISRETCISLDGDKLYNVPEKARYSSLEYVRHQPVQFEAFYDARRLHTLLLLFPVAYQVEPIIQKIPHDLCLALKCLCVLSLNHLPIFELPDLIGNLRLLRYLDLDESRISTLPESVCSLCNLQTLILGRHVTELPKGFGNLINLRHLAYGFVKFPHGVGRLTNLQKLGKFTVEKSTEIARLGELKNLIHLRGLLHISGLHNAMDVMDAKDANLENKQYLCDLSLSWIESGGEKRVEPDEIIECLQPHKNLKRLYISSYPGMRFPSWITKLSSLVNLHLYYCKGIQILSTLGQLPFLETLGFRDMPEWEEWSQRVEGQEKKAGEKSFPRLAYLNITKCPKLTQLPLCQFPSLTQLEINHCKELATLTRFRIPSHVGGDDEEFPRLHKLQIYGCQKLSQLPPVLSSLVELHINCCPQLGSLPMLPLLCVLDLRECNGKTLFTRVGPLPSLTKLTICNIKWLNYLTKEFLQSLTALEELWISDCKDLKAFGSKVVRLQHLSSLQRLTIHRCGKLVLSFPEEEKGLPTNLQHLDLYLNKLKSLPQLDHLTFVTRLEIRMEPRLASFPETGLPPKLQKLVIGQCTRLKSLPKGLRNLTCLEELRIDRCPSITSFTVAEDKEGGLFPPTLKSVRVEDCTNLKELSRFDWIHYNITSHGDLMIKGCHIVTALKEVLIEKCKNLKSLPTRMHNLTSLEKLSIMSCPQLVAFPEGGLPTKVRELEISGCGDNLDSLPKCVGLHRLTSLETLTINHCSGLVSFPKEEEEEWKLPSILKKLSFNHFESLECFLPKWLYNLTSLDTLEIGHASKLTSLPEECPPTTLKELRFMHLESLESLRSNWLNSLTSLQQMHIYNAPKLACFPEEGLPTTLQTLCINNCPLLEESCLKEKGKDWPKIEHITNITIY